MAVNLNKHAWTREEEARALELSVFGMEIVEIAIEMDIAYGAVKARLEILRRKHGITAQRHTHSRARTAHPNALTDREARRDALERRDLTAVFMGDPPPGFSMLDKRRAP